MLDSEITISQIDKADSDEELYEIISSELGRLSNLHPSSTNEGYFEFIKSLPPGLRSMAAVYDLDVSMTLDDLSWHFMNWHSLDFAQETLNGLIDLGATKEAEIFNQAIEIAKRHWEFIGSEGFVEDLMESPLDVEMSPLNRALWEMMSLSNPNGRNLLSYWAPYARRHPQRIANMH